MRRPLEEETEGEVTRVANLGELQQELRARVMRDRAYLIVLAGTNVEALLVAGKEGVGGDWEARQVGGGGELAWMDENGESSGDRTGRSENRKSDSTPCASRRTADRQKPSSDLP